MCACVQFQMRVDLISNPYHSSSEAAKRNIIVSEIYLATKIIISLQLYTDRNYTLFYTKLYGVEIKNDRRSK